MPAQPEFKHRHIGVGESDSQEILSLLGFANLEELTDAIVPAAIRAQEDLQLPQALGEGEALAELKEIIRPE